jgi:membrane protease YdiL (CAAX protease family)
MEPPPDRAEPLPPQAPQPAPEAEGGSATPPAARAPEGPPHLLLALLIAAVALLVVPSLYSYLTTTDSDRSGVEREWSRRMEAFRSRHGSLPEADPTLDDGKDDGATLAVEPGAGVRTFIELLIAGLISLLAVSIAWMASPTVRRRLDLAHTTPRPEPAVRLVDLALALLLLKVLVPLWALAFLQVRGETVSLVERMRISLLIQILAYVVCIALVVRVARLRGGRLGAAGIWPLWETPGIEPSRDLARDIRLGLAIFLPCFFVMYAGNVANLYLVRNWHLLPDTNPFLEALQSELKGGRRWQIFVLMFVSAVPIAAVAEEFLFRGLLYNVLRRRMPRWPAAVVGALLFSFMHGVVSNLISLFLLGLVLTWLYERTGRLLAPVVLHAVNNTIALVLTLMGVGQP